MIERAYANFLLLHVAEAEQLIERTVRTIRNGFLTSPSQTVQSVGDRFRSFREASGVDCNDVFVRQALELC